MKILYLILFMLVSNYVHASSCQLKKTVDGGAEIQCENIFNDGPLEPLEAWTHCSNEHGKGGSPNNCEFTYTRSLKICSQVTGVCAYKVSEGGERSCRKNDYPYKSGLVATSEKPLQCFYSSKPSLLSVRKPENCESRHDCAGLDLNLPSGQSGTSELRVQNFDSLKEMPASIGGEFRISCGNYSHFGYEDPLLYPGEYGKAHFHMFVGNTSVTMNTTAESLSRGNSTCTGGSANLSAYWIPVLMDTKQKRFLTGNKDKLWYYKVGPRADVKFERKAPPKGLSIISHRASWSCTGERIFHRTSIPTDCPLGESIKLAISFPECWDGKNLWLDDQTHMTFPVGISGKAECPPTHPYLIPELSLNLSYKVEYEGQAKNLRLSSDMDMTKPAGSTAHADVIFHWDEDVMQRILDNCINARKDCGAHVFGDGKLY